MALLCAVSKHPFIFEHMYIFVIVDLATFPCFIYMYILYHIIHLMLFRIFNKLTSTYTYFKRTFYIIIMNDKITVLDMNEIYSLIFKKYIHKYYNILLKAKKCNTRNECVHFLKHCYTELKALFVALK